VLELLQGPSWFSFGMQQLTDFAVMVPFRPEQKAPITRAEFLAKARRATNDKARELGWIV